MVNLRAPGARSCELLLADSDGFLAEVDFRESVLGQSVRRGSRTGVAFIADGDVSFPSGPIQLRWLEAPPTVREITCFDRTGSELADVRVEVR